MKFSKDLLELRDKEAKLVRMKRYEEAEKVKMKADLLEEFERNKLEAEVSRIAFLVSLIKTNSRSQLYLNLNLWLPSPLPLKSIRIVALELGETSSIIDHYRYFLL